MQKKIILIFIPALALFIVSFCVSSASLITQSTPKIIGGKAARPDSWPWMIGLVYKNSSPTRGLFCGGSLIAKDWVLTAAHCVLHESHQTFDIFLNHSQLNSQSAERIAVDRIIIHPLYNDTQLTHDIALVKLTTPSEITPVILLPPFTSQDKIVGKPAIALGWGTTSTTFDLPPLDLQQVRLPLIDNPRCAASIKGNPEGKHITEGMLCAGNGLGHKDTCTGDSGGPLVLFDSESQSWRQAGITSWGFGCAEINSYGVYTRLSYYTNFISEHLCSPSQLPSSTSLKLAINGTIVNASWNSLNNISGYRLNYAPYPQALTINSIDMKQTTHFSTQLNLGDAYYVAISTYHGNCSSQFSNIEHFLIQ